MICSLSPLSDARQIKWAKQRNKQQDEENIDENDHGCWRWQMMKMNQIIFVVDGKMLFIEFSGAHFICWYSKIANYVGVWTVQVETRVGEE